MAPKTLPVAGIPLSRGYVAIIDLDDVDRATAFNWHAKGSGHYVYAVAQNGESRQSLHRLIADAPADKDVDHINGNTLDNRKCNLRVCEHGENMRNRRQDPEVTATRKGCWFDRRTQRWWAQIVRGGKRIRLGSYHTEEEAKAAYQAAAHDLDSF
jgi:hypothetical protein